MLSFSYAYWQFVYLLWRNVSPSIDGHFTIGLYVFLLLYCESFVYSEYQTLYNLQSETLKFIICEYFLSFSGLFFHFISSVFRDTVLKKLTKSIFFL